MVLNPVPDCEEPTLELPVEVLPAEPQEVAPGELDRGDDTFEAVSPITAEPVDVQPAQPVKDTGAGGDASVSGPMVPRFEAMAVEGPGASADTPLGAFSPMPKAPVLDLGIEVAIRVAPCDVPANEPGDVPPAEAAAQEPSDVASAEPSEVASQERRVMPEERAEDVASSKPNRSAEVQTLAAEPHSASAMPTPAPQRAAPGMEPLANALDAAVQLAAVANVAAEALEKLKVLLRHKQQLDDLRSAQSVEQKQPFRALRSSQPMLARTSQTAEASTSEARALGVPVLPLRLPPVPLPLAGPEASIGRTRLPLVQRRRPLLERRGLDVRGFMAGFALSWAFGVVLYFFMTAG
jgi:hypothetical protein